MPPAVRAVEFQSTCLREARLADRERSALQPIFQSTCLREARHVPVDVRAGLVEFQSTCLREARLAAGGGLMPADEFQSTCLREARPQGSSGISGLRYFNPRAYVRHDEIGTPSKGGAVFQSTCLREARRLGPTLIPEPPGFQSTCLREARPSGVWTPSGDCDFNPRAYVRHDLGSHGTVYPRCISIHVPT